MHGVPLDPAAALGGARTTYRHSRFLAGWACIHPYAFGIVLVAGSWFVRGPVFMGAMVGESVSYSRQVECTRTGQGVVPTCIAKAGGAGPTVDTVSYDNRRSNMTWLLASAWLEYGGVTFLSAAAVVTFLSLFDEPAYQATPYGLQATKGHVSIAARKRGMFVGSRRVWQRAQADQRQATRDVAKVTGAVAAVKAWKLRHHPAPPVAVKEPRRAKRARRKTTKENTAVNRRSTQAEAARIAQAMRVDAGGPKDQVEAWRQVIADPEPGVLPEPPPEPPVVWSPHPGPHAPEPAAAAFPPGTPLPDSEAVS